MFILENCDFTINKFIRLCEAISSNYLTITMVEYVDIKLPNSFILMRHDVDRIPERALVTAKIEHEYGIRSTYYFRTSKSVCKPNIIRQIKNMGHEIGYHYETLNEAYGDPQKAIDLFQSHLDDLRNICEINTICRHGRPLSKYDSLELWKTYDFRDFGITSEAYLSIGANIFFFSDTDTKGIWDLSDNFGNLRDHIHGQNKLLITETTDDLIDLIESRRLNNLYILLHPEKWSSGSVKWDLRYLGDVAK